MSQLISLPWSPELHAALSSAEVVRQQFRQIKYRAGGRTVAFQVSIAFMPRLKRFLDLRNYVVQTLELPNLFLGLGHDRAPKRLSEQFVPMLELRLARMGVELPRVSARQWRAAKQDWSISNHSPEVAAEVMGHSLDTALRAYSNGTETAHRRELSAFFKSVETTVRAAGERETSEVESAVGGCVEFQQPMAITEDAPVEPTCRSSEGCLFCNKYRVHADEVDIRKLLSCRYRLRVTSNRAPSLEEYDRTFGAVLRRIEFLLDELKKRDAQLVSTVEREVDQEGELDVFWASKLEQLFELGVA